MKILVLTEQWFPDFTGGSGRVATDTSTELARLGHEVTVIAPSYGHLPAVSTPIAGLTLHREVRRGRVIPQTVSDPLLFARAIRRLARQDFDVVIAHQPSGAFAGSQVDAPLAYVFHASGLREARHRRTLGTPRTEALRSLVVEQPLRLLERRAARSSDVILVLSQFSRQLIAADHPSEAHKVVVAGGGIDTTTFAPATDRAALRANLGVAPSTNVLLTVRRLVARTGVGNLLDAFRLVHAERPDTVLVVVGDGEERERLRTQTSALGLDDSVHFLGRVADDEVVRWYQASDLFVLPTVAYEGFGLSTAEALSCGTPVVGTPIGATREILDPLGADRVSASAEPHDLATTVLATLPQLTLDARDQARRYAQAALSCHAVVQRWLAAIPALQD